MVRLPYPVTHIFCLNLSRFPHMFQRAGTILFIFNSKATERLSFWDFFFWLQLQKQYLMFPLNKAYLGISSSLQLKIFIIHTLYTQYPTLCCWLSNLSFITISLLLLLLLLLIMLSSLLLLQQIYQHSPNSMTNRHLQSKKSIFAGIQSYHKVKLLEISLFMYPHKIKIKVMSFILMRIWFENKSHKQELCPDPLCAQRR